MLKEKQEENKQKGHTATRSHDSDCVTLVETLVCINDIRGHMML